MIAAASMGVGTDSFRVGEQASVLAEVRRFGVDLAVWRRSVPSELTRALRAWVEATKEPPFDRFVTDEPAAVEEAVSRTPPSIRDALAVDVSMLLGRFGAIVRARRFRLVVGAVRDDSCRKFHVDAVAMRLVTTYVGAGTEWLAEHAVDRVALARMIESPVEANAAIVSHQAAVQRARAGDVLLLKGSRDPTAGGRGAVHRSPPIEPRDAPRFVLIATVGGPTP